MSLKAPRSVAVALTSTALMGLSALAVPGAANAQAITCNDSAATYEVTGGSVQWGVKQSFRSYLQGPIAKGGWTLSQDVGFLGTPGGADGRFVWPVVADDSSVAGAAAATASGTGSIQMTGHDGILDTTLSNPTVTISGTQGSLKMDYLAKKAESFTPGAAYTWVQGEQVVAVNFTLPTAPNFHGAGTVTAVSGGTSLEDTFNEALGDVYPAGSAMDPVTLVLDIDRTCEVDPGDGDDDDDQGTTPPGVFGSLGNLFGSLGA
ncbi:MAG: HtaA domain-containing protein [Dietzia sp.]|nr:HtaA domain-containing protein [Dietzia sp.]